ncbi:Ig-like domain-containing protein, partial [Nocardioides fonticola]|uniref:Ig-like domain-containing protein n=1 Tax=Nocardioides fonticola TaxID=450363 RepID=UPI0031DCD677
NSVGGSRNLGATGGASGQPVTYAIAAGTTNDACVIVAGRVEFRHAGTCVVTADQAGTDDYEPAATATQTLQVDKTSPGLAVSLPDSGRVGDNVVLVPQTLSASLVTVTSRRPGVCSVDGLKVRFDHVGTCDLAFSQPETGDYVAGSTGGIIEVKQAAQAITGFAPVGAAVVGGASVDLSATGGASGNPVTFAVSGETTNGACTLGSGPSGSTVSFVHAGSCVVTADQAGNTDYTAASQVKRTIVVGKAAQVISGFSLPGSASIGSQAALAATGGAGGAPVVFSVAAGTTNAACTVSGTTVSFVHAGTCVVAADQAGTADYEAASQVVQAVAVARNPQSLVFSLPATASLGGSADLTATGGGSGQSVVFSVDPSTTNAACVIEGTRVRFVHAGSCVVAAFQGGTPDFEEARTLATVNVERAPTTTSVSVTGTQIRALVRSTDASLGSVVGTPSGQVQFLVDGVLLGTAALSDAGVAVLDAVIPAGEHLVVARYLGDGDFAAGVGDYATSSGEVVRRDPVITATVTSARAISASGWYRSPVTVSFACTAGSGALVGACPSPVVIGRSTKGRTVTGTVLADDGGRATVTTEVVKVDLVKPKVRIKGLAGGAAGKPRCVARDKTSGVASCRLKVRTHRDRVVYIAIAKDVAGNTTKVRKTVRR